MILLCLRRCVTRPPWCDALREACGRQTLAPLLCYSSLHSPATQEAEQERPAGAAASSKKGTLSVAAENNIVFIAHSPLGGLKSRRGERNLVTDFPATKTVADARGCSPYAVYLAYLRQRGQRFGGQVLLIVGARTAEVGDGRLECNAV